MVLQKNGKEMQVGNKELILIDGGNYRFRTMAIL